MLKSIMHKAERILQIDSRVNDKFYKACFRRESNEIIKTIEELTAVDSIDNFEDLREFRREVELGRRWFTHDENITNSYCYGIWQALFPDLNPLNSLFYPSVEHGFIPDCIVTNETYKAARMTCATFGNYRKRILQSKLDIPVFTVGPYIQYAQGIYSSEDVLQRKTLNGNTLLFFLGHSVNTSTVTRNEEELIERIADIGKNYSTILINVFWWDIDSPFVDKCNTLGFKVVSAGYLYDPRFLSRLRTIIELSDTIYSDSLGTHTAYCAALDKPCHYVDVNLQTEDKGVANIDRGEIERVIRDANEMLCCGNSEIAPILRHYWGLGTILSAVERQYLCEISHEIFLRAKGRRSLVKFVVNELLVDYERENFNKYRLLMDAIGTSNE